MEVKGLEKEENAYFYNKNKTLWLFNNESNCRNKIRIKSSIKYVQDIQTDVFYSNVFNIHINNVIKNVIDNAEEKIKILCNDILNETNNSLINFDNINNYYKNNGPRPGGLGN
ncbi:hypothetical protein [Deferribacter desulfuricans]|uniref:hypothetical protein n=1 Tax=Deferribacter desulfuricans TaxID=197162 RepID=UPI00031E5673|nr:hypothetical protein [Deferribacter desulfuricans]